MTHGHGVDEIRQRLSRKSSVQHLRDFVYGGIDGTVTTFAIVAGSEGADLPLATILVLGFANVLADGFSMAAANFSGIRAESQQVERLRARENRHIDQHREGEREEMRQILHLRGYRGTALEELVDRITANRELWIELMLLNEYGVSPLSGNPLRAAVATFAAFVACGSLPLIPFVLGVANPFATSMIVTGMVFGLIGSLKSLWTDGSWWKSALETLAIGSVAALIAHQAGALISGWT